MLPGRGNKINFAYFLRGIEYMRFDWNANQSSPGYPKILAQEWHTTTPFTEDFDGVVVGQAGAFANKAYLFKTLPATVDGNGNPVPPGTAGSTDVFTPGYIRYDFNAENTEGSLASPTEVITHWPGLLPLLDTRPAIDIALKWCKDAVDALQQSLTPVVEAALSHHFKTSLPTGSRYGTARTDAPLY